VDSRSFLDNLKISGLLHDEQVAQVSGRFSNSAVQVIVNDLVDEGLLTPFQVKQLHAGQPKGLVLGQYHLLDELGRGGYGCVYKAQHKLMNRIVALKVIAPERIEDSRARDWFRREVLAATQLMHPNIALAYDADEIDGILFFAMEFIDGLNLDALLRERGPLPIGTACEMLLQTAKALQYAQEKGMVHRDIKPANLLIPRDTIAATAGDFAGSSLGAVRPVLVKVVDFGLARLQSSSATNTLVLQNERSFVGTPAYVSPEQARNLHDVDIRSDLYSLGCTFYHALAGQPPFRADTPLQLLVQHLEKEPDPIENYRPEIPPALASIIRRLMAKKPEKRFQTPAELLSELGFFYTLDRSGVQRTIPGGSSAWERRPTPSGIMEKPPLGKPAIAFKRSPDRPAQSAAQESEYLATRVCSWDDGKESLKAATPSAQSRPIPRPAALDATATYVTAETPATPLAAPIDDGKERPLDRDLAMYWREWASLVADLAARRTIALDDASYRTLHRHLLDACKAQAANADPRQASLFHRIADLVQPWLTLAALGAMEQETLASLHTQCQAINERLGTSPGSYRWFIAAVLLILAAGAGYAFLQFANNLPASSYAGLIQQNPVVALVVLGPIALISSTLLLKKVLRSPTT
jgi:eukaryotic-like serine/threonine-protein kinase